MNQLVKSFFIFTILVLGFQKNLQAQAESDIVITEIFYNQPGADTLEYFEIYNNGSTPYDLTGVSLSDGVEFTFPAMSLDAGDYLCITKADTALFRAFFGVGALQWTTGTLGNTGEDIVLRTPTWDIIDSVRFNDKLPWDTLPDGHGYSLVLCDPNDDNSMPHYWSHSNKLLGNYLGLGLIYGSPDSAASACTPNGDIQPPHVDKARAISANTITVEFNEEVDATALNSANYSGLGTITNIEMDSLKETATLTLASDLPIGTYANLIVFGIQDTTGQPMAALEIHPIVYNPGTANLVITEIMYNHPLSDTLEFVEVYNNSGVAEDIGGYKFTKGIDFWFPSNYTIDPYSYVIIAESANIFDLFFGTTNSFEFSGKLSNSGELIKLTNSLSEVIDTVRYRDTLGWPEEADGLGPSLEYTCASSEFNDYGNNWSYSTNYVKDLLGSPIYATPGYHIILTAECTVGTEASVESSLAIYPNPANKEVNVVLPTDKGELSIYNLTGVEVLSSEVSGSLITLDVSDLSSGVYIVQYSEGANIITSKLIIE